MKTVKNVAFPYSHYVMKPIPKTIDIPPHIRMKKYIPSQSISMIKTDEDIEKLRYAGKIASKVLMKAMRSIEGKECRCGDDVDELVYDEIIRNNCYPSSLGFMGFPKTLCISVNDTLCHGIPNTIPFKEGDYINLDLTVYYKGMHADTSAMVSVGNVDLKIKTLIDKARQAMFEGIEVCKPGNLINLIGKSIEEYTKKNHLTICKEFCGHGIGKEIHMNPPILHYKNNQVPHLIMQPGMTFTIEPIILLNPYQNNLSLSPDNWSIISKNNPSAQWEHTILITKSGHDIITLRDNERVLH